MMGDATQRQQHINHTVDFFAAVQQGILPAVSFVKPDGLLVSPFSRGGKVVHSCNEYVSILKFIERNWNLAPLTAAAATICRTPVASRDNPYVPNNSPTIGDLFDMFHFGSGDGRSDDRSRTLRRSAKQQPGKSRAAFCILSSRTDAARTR
jgi:hypothetical protein